MEGKDTPSMQLELPTSVVDNIVASLEKRVINRILKNPRDFFPEIKLDKFELLSTTEVADELRTHKNTVQKLCREKKINHMTPNGRTIMISRQQLNEYLETVTESN